MTSQTLSEEPITVRHGTGWVFLGFTMLVTVPVLLAAFAPVRSSTPALAVTALAVTVTAYVYFVAPRVIVSPAGITVENSWREHVIPWGALVDVETRFDLTLVTSQGRVHAQAAPTPGLMSGLRRRPDPGRPPGAAGPAPGRARPGGASPSVSEALAEVIRDHLAALGAAGALDRTQRPVTTLRVTSLALTAGGLALAVVLWLLTVA